MVLNLSFEELWCVFARFTVVVVADFGDICINK